VPGRRTVQAANLHIQGASVLIFDLSVSLSTIFHAAKMKEITTIRMLASGT
jgi:hypothetical protein